VARSSSIAAQYDRLVERRAELAPRSVHPVHQQAVKVLIDLIGMGELFSTRKVPAPLRAMMRTLKHMEPELVRELADVDPEVMREFLRDLSERINTVVTAGIDNGPSAPPPPRQDQPPA
jgi:hypothetical protein